MKYFIVLFFFLCLSLQAQQNKIDKPIAINSNKSADDEQDPPDDLKVDKMPTPIKTVYPKYPFIARQDSVEGVLWIKLLVNDDGTVKKSKVFKSTFTKNRIEIDIEHASSSVKLAMDSLTLESVKTVGQWKFSPAMLNDKPVKVWVVLPLKFRLDPSQPDSKTKK